MVLTEGARMLGEARTFEDLKQVRDLAQAAAAYARARGLGAEAQQYAVEIQAVASRRMAELDPPATLKRSGLISPGGDISRQSRSKNRDLLALTEDEVRQEVRSRKDPSLSRVRQVAKNAKAAAAGDAAPGEAPDVATERWRVATGDFRSADIADESVDLILTDPPYPAKDAPLWDALAELALRVLRPGGILAALCGKIDLPDRMDRLAASGLHYGWMYCQPLPGSSTRILGRHVAQGWKPWLCYSKGPWPSGRINWHGDMLTPGGRDKSAYAWQQQLAPAVSLIGCLAPTDGMVLDPFLGSGTYGVAALQAGRRFIGVELDLRRAADAAGRIQAA
jgi:hypothetical protein